MRGVVGRELCKEKGVGRGENRVEVWRKVGYEINYGGCCRKKRYGLWEGKVGWGTKGPGRRRKPAVVDGRAQGSLKCEGRLEGKE